MKEDKSSKVLKELLLIASILFIIYIMYNLYDVMYSFIFSIIFLIILYNYGLVMKTNNIEIPPYWLLILPVIIGLTTGIIYLEKLYMEYLIYISFILLMIIISTPRINKEILGQLFVKESHVYILYMITILLVFIYSNPGLWIFLGPILEYYVTAYYIISCKDTRGIDTTGRMLLSVSIPLLFLQGLIPSIYSIFLNSVKNHPRSMSKIRYIIPVDYALRIIIAIGVLQWNPVSPA